MVQVEWADSALADLQEIYDFIARDSSHYARATVEKITDTATCLANSPQMGEILPEFPRQIYRQLIVGTYRLVYREDLYNNRVIVMGVIHGAREWPPSKLGDY